VFFVADDALSNANDDVRICFSINVGRMQVNCLQHMYISIIIITSATCWCKVMFYLLFVCLLLNSISQKVLGGFLGNRQIIDQKRENFVKFWKFRHIG